VKPANKAQQVKLDKPVKLAKPVIQALRAQQGQPDQLDQQVKLDILVL
jgi:hypothetical protein